MRVLYLLFLVLPALGQQSWDALRQLKPGDRVRVLEIAGPEHNGTFEEFSPEALTLRTGKAELSLERRRVRRIQVPSGARRARNVAIGAGVGLALGAVIDQTLGAYIRNESSESGAVRAITYIAPAAIVGGISAAFRPWRTIYGR